MVNRLVTLKKALADFKPKLVNHFDGSVYPSEILRSRKNEPL